MLGDGHAPELAPPQSQAVGVGWTTTFSAAFQATDADAGDVLTMALVDPPGTWLRAVNVRETAPGTWVGDLEITAAPCPAGTDSYDLAVLASDGTFAATEGFTLDIGGCEIP